ncbi:MAG: zinc ABC transporter substrate-binding protein [Chloroflexota bacterium]|nr:zinc ABC transporter substrate-binding protein [Chloroflexota bacterium]
MTGTDCSPARARRPWWALFVLLALLLSPAVGRAQEATPAAGGMVDVLPTPAPLPAAMPRAEGPLVVVATTGILADLVAQVGGERVEVVSLLPANADPHDFEPAPEDLVRVEGADSVVRHGLGLDEWSEGLIENADAELPVIVATEGIETRPSDDEEFAEGDPHVWFDPMRTGEMVRNIAAGLSEVDPDGEATYQARGDAYAAELRVLDAAIQAAIDTVPRERRKLVTNHDALGYYADRYGLEIVGTVIPGLETTAEPSAREVATLIEAIEREGVPAIFAENTTSPALAEELAAEAGVRVVDDLYTDSLGEPGSGADTYLGLMRTDTTLIVEALR